MEVVQRFCHRGMFLIWVFLPVGAKSFAGNDVGTVDPAVADAVDGTVCMSDGNWSARARWRGRKIFRPYGCRHWCGRPYSFRIPCQLEASGS